MLDVSFCIQAQEYIDKFEYEMAQKFCQRALEIDHDHIKALETTGALLLELGNTDGAKQVHLFSMNSFLTHNHNKMHLRYIAVENIVRKGEIACNKQFILFSQCFLPCMVLQF